MPCNQYPDAPGVRRPMQQVSKRTWCPQSHATTILTHQAYGAFPADSLHLGTQLLHPTHIFFLLMHDLAPTADEQVQVNASADHLLMLAPGVGQAAEPPARQVGTADRNRSPSDPHSGDPLANMSVPDSGQESGSASPASEISSCYFTASKLLLPLPSFSSMLAAETDVWSPLPSVSALA